MIIRSTGFILPNLIGSGSALNFAYILYLHLRSERAASTLIETTVRRWFVMSILTRRYSSNPETVFDLERFVLQRKSCVVPTSSPIRDHGISETNTGNR